MKRRVCLGVDKQGRVRNLGLGEPCFMVLGAVAAEAGAEGVGYVALLLVSSVYLGWHYAVDGIAGIALAFGVLLGDEAGDGGALGLVAAAGRANRQPGHTLA